MVTDKRRAEFARRLNESLDDHGVPPKGQGRQVVVAKMFGVSQKGARKWLEGESIPVMTRVTEIAGRLGVAVEWLLSGRGDKRAVATVLIGTPPPPAVTSEPHVFIDADVLRLILDEIKARRPGAARGKMPQKSESLAVVTADIYARVILDRRKKDRALIKSIVSRSIQEGALRALYDEGGDARQTESGAGDE